MPKVKKYKRAKNQEKELIKAFIKVILISNMLK